VIPRTEHQFSPLTNTANLKSIASVTGYLQKSLGRLTKYITSIDLKKYN